MRVRPIVALLAASALALPLSVVAHQKPVEFKPEALWDGRKIVPFKAIDDPKMVAAKDAGFLGDDEYVLGVAINGEARAYPTRFAWWHHVINDTVGRKPVAVTYCSVCNTGLNFNREVTSDGKKKTLRLDFYGLYFGVVSFVDRETESVIPQVSGQAVNGPLAGLELEALPVLDTTWREWRKLHPETLVMSPDNPFQRFYRPADQPEKRGHDRFPAPFFRPTVIRGDLRLPPFDKILGVTLRGAGGGESRLRRAYPIKTLEGVGCVLNDEFDKQAIVVMLEPATVTAVAFSRVVDGRKLTFERRKNADGSFAIHDLDTGSRWDFAGRAVAGPLAGKSLAVVENHLSQWYGWSAYFPDTQIYGRDDRPKPGNPFD